MAKKPPAIDGGFLIVGGQKIRLLDLAKALERLGVESRDAGGLDVGGGDRPGGTIGGNADGPLPVPVHQPRGPDVENMGKGVPQGDASVLFAKLELRDAGRGDPAGDLGVKGSPKLGLGVPAPLPGEPQSVLSAGVEHGQSINPRLLIRQGGNLANVAGSTAKARRVASGLSMAAIAAKVGLTAPRVMQLESGEAWSLRNLEAFAEALGCDPVALLGGHVLDEAEAALIGAARQGDHRLAMEALVRVLQGNARLP